MNLKNVSQYVAGIKLNLPPSTNSTVPVKYAPPLLVRNKMTPAISSSVPVLSSGITDLGKTPSPIMPAASSEGNTFESQT
jgi:hypothetical protein